jgi:hypothetical protein
MKSAAKRHRKLVANLATKRSKLRERKVDENLMGCGRKSYTAAWQQISCVQFHVAQISVFEERADQPFSIATMELVMCGTYEAISFFQTVAPRIQLVCYLYDIFNSGRVAKRSLAAR